MVEVVTGAEGFDIAKYTVAAIIPTMIIIIIVQVAAFERPLRSLDLFNIIHLTIY